MAIRTRSFTPAGLLAASGGVLALGPATLGHLLVTEEATERYGEVVS